MRGADRRLVTHGEVERGRPIGIEVDGQPLAGFDGESLAAVMLAAGQRVFRLAVRSGSPRGLFCGMGVCYECLMVVDGQPNVRACMTPARDGMRATTQRGPGHGVSPVPRSV